MENNVKKGLKISSGGKIDRESTQTLQRKELPEQILQRKDLPHQITSEKDPADNY